MGYKYHGIDLFCGAGGMSVGAMRAGVDVKIAVEIDKFAAKTFNANHPKTDLFNSDIRKFKPKKNNGNALKILFGGPPCQRGGEITDNSTIELVALRFVARQYL